MLEKELEQRFVKEVKRRGGTALKFTTPSLAGMPDRLVILPSPTGPHIGFVELKRPGGKPRPLQQHRIDWLHTLGVTALVLNHPNDIEKAINEIQTT